MDIKIDLEAYEEVQGQDYPYTKDIQCSLERDIDDEKIIKMTFGFNKPYFVNMDELIKAINILKY